MAHYNTGFQNGFFVVRLHCNELFYFAKPQGGGIDCHMRKEGPGNSQGASRACLEWGEILKISPKNPVKNFFHVY
jgi:hypothetical protein